MLPSVFLAYGLQVQVVDLFELKAYENYVDPTLKTSLTHHKTCSAVRSRVCVCVCGQAGNSTLNATLRLDGGELTHRSEFLLKKFGSALFRLKDF